LVSHSLNQGIAKVGIGFIPSFMMNLGKRHFSSCKEFDLGMIKEILKTIFSDGLQRTNHPAGIAHNEKWMT